MKKICIVTGTRAEYGLLYWLIKGVHEDPELDLQLLVTGMHLSPEFGLTWKQIVADGFPISKKLKCFCLQIQQLEFQNQWDWLKSLLPRHLNNYNQIF